MGTSLDGFIARRNGTYDFLPTDGGEPHGYDEFIASVDTIVIGRHTFDMVMTLPSWPYGDKLVVVLSHRPLSLSTIPGRVHQMSGEHSPVRCRPAGYQAPAYRYSSVQEWTRNK